MERRLIKKLNTYALAIGSKVHFPNKDIICAADIEQPSKTHIRDGYYLFCGETVESITQDARTYFEIEDVPEPVMPAKPN